MGRLIQMIDRHTKGWIVSMLIVLSIATVGAILTAMYMPTPEIEAASERTVGPPVGFFSPVKVLAVVVVLLALLYWFDRGESV